MVQDTHRGRESRGTGECGSTGAPGPAASALDLLYWQDEILQVMFWLLGEGFAEEATVSDLRRFLDGPLEVLERSLDDLVGAQLVERAQRSYRLTESGKGEAQRRFVDEFRPLLGKTGHGECSDDCWCHDPDHAGEPCPATIHSHATHDS